MVVRFGGLVLLAAFAVACGEPAGTGESTAPECVMPSAVEFTCQDGFYPVVAHSRGSERGMVKLGEQPPSGAGWVFGGFTCIRDDYTLERANSESRDEAWRGHQNRTSVWRGRPELVREMRWVDTQGGQRVMLHMQCAGDASPTRAHRLDVYAAELGQDVRELEPIETTLWPENAVTPPTDVWPEIDTLGNIIE